MAQKENIRDLTSSSLTVLRFARPLWSQLFRIQGGYLPPVYNLLKFFWLNSGTTIALFKVSAWAPCRRLAYDSEKKILIGYAWPLSSWASW